MDWIGGFSFYTFFNESLNKEATLTGAQRINRALTDYDERLFFARNDDTGQWTVYVKMERGLGYPVVHGETAMPIFAFPWYVHPGDLDVAEIMDRIKDSDSQRRGIELLERMNAHNEKLKEPFERAASEATGIAAEVIESYKHDQGQTSHKRIFMRPFKKTAVRGH